jgi:hypothetical protein
VGCEELPLFFEFAGESLAKEDDLSGGVWFDYGGTALSTLAVANKNARLNPRWVFIADPPRVRFLH